MKSLSRLQKYLDSQFSGCFLIPAKSGGKVPLHPHKDGKYNSKKFLDSGYKSCEHGCLIVLTSKLIVVDVDDLNTCNALETNIPEFLSTVRCNTKHGRHYYFVRTESCDSMWDSSRKLKYSTGEIINIDLKTQNSNNKSPGTISIPPSPNKTWVSALSESDVLNMPQKFIDFHKHFWGGHTKKEIDVSTKFIYNAPQHQEVITLVDILDKHRADERSSWIELGWCLHNIDVNLLELWDTWSQSSFKYKTGECEKLWISMRNDGLNIGTLKMWAREDDPEAYQKYVDDKQNAVFNNGDIDQIQAFIKKQFHYPPTRIRDLAVKTYDDTKYIFANIDETYCNISESKHDNSEIYITIGFEKSSEKCHHESCAEKIHLEIKTPKDIKKIIKNLDVKDCDPIEIFQKFVKDSPKTNPELSEIEKMDLELTPSRSNFHGTRYALANNRYCPLHKIYHPNAENCLMLSESSRSFAVGCNLDRWGTYPIDGAQIPQNIYQIVTGNTINNYYNTDENGIDSEGNTIDDNYAARKFVNLMRDKIVFTEDKIWVYNSKKGIWSEKENDLNLQILKHEHDLKFTAQVKNSTVMHNYSGMVQKKINMIKCIPQFCTNDNFFDYDKIKTGFGKLLFDDCIYDMDSDTFIDFDANIVFFDRIARSKPERNQQLIDGLNRKLFEDPYLDIKNGIRFKQEIALAIHGGFTNRRKLVSGHGVSSSSKGLITDCCLQTFENYCGIYSLSSMIKDKWSPNDPKCYGFVIDIAKKRMAWANENDSTLKLSTSIMNTVVSGGDTFKARYLSKNPIYLVNYATMFAMTNNVLKFDNKNDAVIDRYDGAINFEIAFKDRPDPDNIYQKLKDPKLRSDLIKTREYKDAFFWIIIDEFKNLKNTNNNFSKIPIELTVPDGFYEEVQSGTNNLDIIDIFHKYYQKSNDRKAFITLEEVADTINDHSSGEIDDKLAVKKQLQQNGLIFDMKSTTVNKKRIRGRLFGYSYKKDSDELS